MNSDIPQNKFYDLQIIDQMCRGNQEQVKKMAQIFTVEVSKTIGEISTAFSEKDFSKMKDLAHKVKPTLGYFGTKELEKEVVYVENLLNTDFEISELELKITAINELSEKIVNQLKSDFNV